MAAGCGGYNDTALDQLRQCPRAQAALGESIDWASFGCSSGQTSTGSGTGSASWSMPVAGSKSAGRYSFNLSKTGGGWAVRRAVLTVGDDEIDVRRCAPVTGPAFAETVRRTARVSAAIGPTPVPLGTTCSLQMGPADRKGAHPCRLIVDCGGRRLYGTGTTGYLDCFLDQGPGPGQPVLEDSEFSDKSGDPAVDLKVRSGQAIISDKVPEGLWTLTLQLDGQ
jgi:hypothetical protein